MKVIRSELMGDFSFRRAISIYLDAVNIFIRMVMIMGGGGSRRK